MAFGDAHQRQRKYASILDQYRMVVRTLGGDRRAVVHADNFVVHPSASRSRTTFSHDAYLVGGAVQRRLGFDLVSTEDPMLCGLAGALLRARFGLPLSVQIAGDMIDNPYWLRERRANPALNAIGRWLVGSADSVRVVSERERAKLVALGVAPDRVSNLGWISDFRRFDALDADDARALRASQARLPETSRASNPRPGRAERARALRRDSCPRPRSKRESCRPSPGRRSHRR